MARKGACRYLAYGTATQARSHQAYTVGWTKVTLPGSHGKKRKHLEDERVGSIYLNMLKKSISKIWSTLFPRGLSRSPFLPFLVISILLLGPIVAWRLHRLGMFHTMESEVKGDAGADLPRPGGMDPLELHVPLEADSNRPQFLTMTLLPGLGNSVLQISANLPGLGSTPLLAAPTGDDLVNGKSGTPNGFNDDHGAIEFPWGGSLAGSVTPVGAAITIPWKGKQIEASTEASANSEVAEGGLLRLYSANSVEKQTQEGNPSFVATYHNVGGEGRWLSKNDVVVSARLTSASIELTLDVKNTGDTPEPVGAGWHPRFLLPANGRRQALIQLPAGSRMQISPQSLPTGSLEPTATTDRFVTRPALIGPASLDTTIANPKATGKDAWPTLLNVAAGYGIRIGSLSTSVKAVRAYSPEDANYVSLGVQTNLDDAFGKQWLSAATAGMVTLLPGETFQWKVRLEIFALPKA